MGQTTIPLALKRSFLRGQSFWRLLSGYDDDLASINCHSIYVRECEEFVGRIVSSKDVQCQPRRHLEVTVDVCS